MVLQFPDRFKACRSEIQRLRLDDPVFGQLWQDYCDVLKALGTTNELLRLREELEIEIDEVLDKR